MHALSAELCLSAIKYSWAQSSAHCLLTILTQLYQYWTFAFLQFTDFPQKSPITYLCVISNINNSLCALFSRGIAKAGEPNNLSPVSPGVLFMDPSVHGTLRRKQRRLARENAGVLEAIRKGANLAIQECQYQFRNRWWNCSTKNFLRGKNLFGKIVDRGK